MTVNRPVERPPRRLEEQAKKARRRRGWLPFATAAIALSGAVLVLYPSAASWISTYNQSLVVSSHSDSLIGVDPDVDEQLASAYDYNTKLSSGAILASNANVPTGSGAVQDPNTVDYWDQLKAPDGVMARLQIPAINVDLPIFHGTSESTLLEGAGHLQGTSLPVGGESAHAVITAHRGLASATMFTDLDRVVVGDVFTLATFGEVLSYQVIDTQVVAPEDTASLRQQEGQDLVTLITCTPLGINSHRILVTAERITPTPVEAIEAAEAPATPGFPWWALWALFALTLIISYLIWDARGARRRPAPVINSPAGAPLPHPVKPLSGSRPDA